MAVSVRELFLIVRAQDQASRNLRFVGANLRSLASTAELQNAKARAANRLRDIQLRQESQRLRIADLASNISTQQGKLDEAGNARLKARVLAQKELATIQQRGLEMQRRAAQLEAALARPGTRLTGPGTQRLSRAAAQQELRTINEGLTQMEPAMQKVRAESAAVGEAFAAQGRAVSKAENAHARATNTLQSLGMAEQNAVKHLREMELAERQMKWRNIGAAGRALTNMGRTMTFVGGVGVAALGFAANSAAKFSRSTQLAATQASSSLQGIASKNVQIQKVILAQMQRFPATADEMSQSLYDIFSGTNVQRVSKGAQLLKIFNKAAVAGQASLNDVTNAGISVLNTYGLKVRQMPSVMNKFFAAVRFGRMNVTQFTQSFNQLVPAFESAHQSINTMFGSMAFLTRMMPSQRMAAVGLARGVELLSSGAMVKGLKQVGVSVTDVHHRLLPLPVVIENILKKFPRLAKDQNVGNFIKSISNQQGTIQARRALTFLFRDFGKYRQMLHLVSGDQNEFGRSFRALAETDGNKWAVMLNKLKVLWLQLGRAALPALIDLSKNLITVVNWFNRLNDATRGSAAHFAVYGAALLILMGLFTQLIGIVQGFISTIGILVTRLLPATTAFEDLAVAEAAAASAAEGGFLAALGSAGVVAGIVAAGAALGVFAYWLSTTGKDANAWTGEIQSMTHTADEAGNAIERMGKKFSNLPHDMGAIVGDRANIMNIRSQISQTRQELSKAPKSARPALRANLSNLFQQQADAFEQLRRDQRTATSDRGAFGKVIQNFNKQADVLHKLRGEADKYRATIKKFNQEAQTGRAALGPMIGKDRLDAAKKGLADVTHRASQLGSTLRTKVMNVFKGLESRRLIPQLNQNQLLRLTQRTIQSGKFPSLAQIKMDIKTNFGPAKHGVQTFKQWVNGKLKPSPQLVPKWKDKQARTGVINLRHMVHNSFDAAQFNVLGANVDSGIAAGIRANMTPIASAVRDSVSLAISTGQAAAKARSPSRETRDKIGIPIAQGIIVGMQKMEPNVAKAAGDMTKKATDAAGKKIIQGVSQSLVKQAGGIKAAFKSIADTMASTFDEIKSSAQDAFGGIFQGTSANQGLQTIMGFGGKVPFSAVSGDLKAQLNRYSAWTHALARLRKRGIPDALYQQLLAAGPDSLPAIQALASASPAQLHSYERMFKREQRMISRQTHAAFAVQMDEWKKMGKNMAFGILTGLRSESPAIIAWLRHLAKEMFHTVKKHNKSNSPSKLYEEEGRNMLDGLQLGMRAYTPSFAWPGQMGGGGGRHVHYHYNQTLVRGNESDATFMRKARFHYESRIPRQ